MAGRAEWLIDAAFDRFLDTTTQIAHKNRLTDEQIIGMVGRRVGTDAADALTNWIKEDRGY